MPSFPPAHVIGMYMAFQMFPNKSKVPNLVPGAAAEGTVESLPAMQPWAHGKQVGHQACYLLFSSVYRLISKPDVTAHRREKMATGRCPAAAAALLLPALLWTMRRYMRGGAFRIRFLIVVRICYMGTDTKTCAEPRAPRVYGSKRRERCYERTRQRAPKPPKVKGTAPGAN